MAVGNVLMLDASPSLGDRGLLAYVVDFLANAGSEVPGEASEFKFDFIESEFRMAVDARGGSAVEYNVGNENGYSALSVYLNFGGNGSVHKHDGENVPCRSGENFSIYSLTSGVAARADATCPALFIISCEAPRVSNHFMHDFEFLVAAICRGVFPVTF